MKKTIKRQIVEFVISKGSAGRMEIVEFYVDLKNGKGHYKENKKSPVWIGYDFDKETGKYNPIFHETKTQNRFRGVLSSGFNKCYEEWQESYISQLKSSSPNLMDFHYPIRKAWLMDQSTKEFLIKGEDGKYRGVIKE